MKVLELVYEIKHCFQLKFQFFFYFKTIILGIKIFISYIAFIS